MTSFEQLYLRNEKYFEKEYWTKDAENEALNNMPFPVFFFD